MTFDPSAYGPKAAAILGDGQRLMGLGPGTPDIRLRPLLASFNPLADLGRPVKNREMAQAFLSALWLYHDFLDESHTISQDLPSATGSFLHAVMHRREPDASNAKYWWRRVGPHAAFGPLADAAVKLGYECRDGWDPVAFVDRCEAARGRDTPEEHLLRQVQRLECQLLFDFCYRWAFGIA